VRQLPDALLVIVGEGSRRDVVDELVAKLPQNVEHIERLLPDGVSDQMDRSTVLVLPSRSEGLGRVLVESMARGRGIVASRVGGIPDVARDGREALLVEPGDVDELAATLVRVLTDRALAERLGHAAFERYQEWHTTPAEYAARVRSLVEASLDGAATAGGRG
jgi:glycosyltransferase involved in cell wall biosynthesis